MSKKESEKNVDVIEVVKEEEPKKGVPLFSGNLKKKKNSEKIEDTLKVVDEKTPTEDAADQDIIPIEDMPVIEEEPPLSEDFDDPEDVVFRDFHVVGNQVDVRLARKKWNHVMSWFHFQITKKKEFVRDESLMNYIRRVECMLSDINKKDEQLVTVTSDFRVVFEVARVLKKEDKKAPMTEYTKEFSVAILEASEEISALQS